MLMTGILKQNYLAAGLELNVAKTSILPKGTTAQAVFDMAQTIIQATASLAHLRNDFLVDSF
jgi:hypothetical protein